MKDPNNDPTVRFLNIKVDFSKEYLIFHCEEGEFFKADQIFIYDILWLIKFWFI